MILWASKPTEETMPALPHLGRRAWRWAVEVEPWSITVEEQVRFMDVANPAWSSGTEYVLVGVFREMKLGFFRDMYDGWHNAAWIGPLHVGWSLHGFEAAKAKVEDLWQRT